VNCIVRGIKESTGGDALRSIQELFHQFANGAGSALG
jgi:hypothetical protein